MRWDPPATLPPYMDERINVDIGALVIGLCLIVGTCSILILIGTLAALTLRIVGWR